MGSPMRVTSMNIKPCAGLPRIQGQARTSVMECKMRRIHNQDAYERAQHVNLAGDASMRLSVEEEKKRQQADRERMRMIAAAMSSKTKPNPS